MKRPPLEQVGGRKFVNLESVHGCVMRCIKKDQRKKWLFSQPHILNFFTHQPNDRTNRTHTAYRYGPHTTTVFVMMLVSAQLYC